MRTHVSGAYPPDWPLISREVKARAGWRCERCGHPDDPALRGRLRVAPGRLPCDAACTHPRDDKQRVLTVHHLDGDKSCCEDWNLAPLCQACHLSVQSRVEFRRPYLLPHTPWMAAHVAAYNAWARDHGRTQMPNAGRAALAAAEGGDARAARV